MALALRPTRVFRIKDVLALVGSEAITFLFHVGGVVQLWAASTRVIFTSRWDREAIVRQLFLIGNRSMGIVALIALFTGMVLALQFMVSLARFGLKLYTGQVVGLSLTRELGPVLTSLMVSARVGSGIAAELGSMMVTEQVLAIEAMGANPLQRLVAPRVIATMIATPLLTVLADAIGIFGGLVISMGDSAITPTYYLRQVWQTVALSDFTHGLAKTVFFAGIVAYIACYEGLTTYGGTEGVGRSTTRAVVYASILIFITDFFLTKLFIVL
ncbi:MAG: ABC transporter permease [Deltaproteobacteria bacterium]|nr:ABC transporter permease [Deltaproteobacteria bacterium]